MRVVLLLLLFWAQIVAVSEVSASEDEANIIMLTWRGKTAAEVAFEEALAASNKKIRITHFDAGRDRRALGEYLHSNEAEIRSADVVYTFGTLTARTVKAFGLKGVPHVFNIVADPVGTGLVDSLDNPGADRTGAKNTVPLRPVFEVLCAATPFSKVAVLFDPREVTSEAQVFQLEEALAPLGKAVKPVRFVPDAGNLSNQTDYIRNQLSDVDLVYIPAVSSYVGQTGLISEVSPKDAVIVGAIEAYVGKGATIAIGVDYSERGRTAAEMVLAILDGVSPEVIPVREVAIEDAIIVIDQDDPRSKKIDVDAIEGMVRVIQ